MIFKSVQELADQPAAATAGQLQCSKQAVCPDDLFPTPTVNMLAQSRSRDVHSQQLPVGAPCQQFALPVDAECKACRLDLCSVARPHMRAFHISWLAFFTTFLATFAPAALLPVLRDDLDLTNADIGNAGIASVCGAIGSRLLMGTLSDVFGPRYSSAMVLLGTTPFVFGMCLMTNAASFVAMRMLVGLSLSMFVVNQFWMTQMFNTKLVGRANALSAGWGNTGAGATLLLMPLLYEAFAKTLSPGMAWRVAFIVPGCLQLVLGMMVLVFADDTPLGSVSLLNRDRGHFRRTNPCHSWQSAVANYRSYVMALSYALSFGVELTTNNVIAFYLFTHFGLSLTTAGILGGVLGLMNVCSRYLGGAGSDYAASIRGMRGRLWVLQSVLLLEGVFCLLVGLAHDSLPATLGMLVVFSFFCQMACGAVFGIVPFVSKRSTGMVVGIVAAGGSLGSAVTQAIFFSYFDFTTYEGFYWMGTTIICLGAFTGLLYWPMWGGMFCGPQSGMSEERYYLSEYSNTERAAGLHLPALAFAHEARSERDTASCCGQPCSIMSMVRGGASHPQLQEPSIGGSSNHSRSGLLPRGLQLAVPVLPPSAAAAGPAVAVAASGCLPQYAVPSARHHTAAGSAAAGGESLYAVASDVSRICAASNR